MAFVKEKISQEDFDKYKIQRYGKKIPNALYPGSSWTIDRDKNIHLINFSTGGREPEESNIRKFIFFSNGDIYLISMLLDIIQLGEKSWTFTWTLKHCEFIKDLSNTTIAKYSYDEIILKLKEAMRTYRLAGIDENYDAEISILFNF